MDEIKSKLIDEIFSNFQKMARTVRSDPGGWMGLNLTIVQLKSLSFIDFKGSTNFKSLADALGVTPPSVTGIIDRLVGQGLVSREENPENRRMQILRLTQKGRKLLDQLLELHKIKMTALLSQLSPQDLSDLARISDTLVKAESFWRMSKEEHITT